MSSDEIKLEVYSFEQNPGVVVTLRNRKEYNTGKRFNIEESEELEGSDIVSIQVINSVSDLDSVDTTAESRP